MRLVGYLPSNNFEPSLRSFINQATAQHDGRDPRGKASTTSEIEATSDAAFHPSIFGESPDVISRLQERNYPNQKITIILPLLSDGVLVLGRTKAECILRVPGDGDLVSELKLRMDKGYYTLDSLDDPYVLASLLKLWLRKLRDPLVPDEMYNDCVSRSNYPEACVSMPVTDN
ncbi:hypothetical protein BC629DRAFT_1596971 [Irpex lacteus]|nr:hypothetical protein BC629DRAFT_1596971 [Irpex lacteus]